MRQVCKWYLLRGFVHRTYVGLGGAPGLGIPALHIIDTGTYGCVGTNTLYMRDFIYTHAHLIILSMLCVVPICLYTYVHVCISVCIHNITGDVYAEAQHPAKHAHACVKSKTQKKQSWHTHICLYTYAHVKTHTITHTHIYIYIYAHTCMYLHMRGRQYSFIIIVPCHG